MSTGLPDYLKMAKANPLANRAPWYKNTAPTYAGIMLWFVFWLGATDVKNLGGVLSQGIWVPIVGLALAALLCHAFYYVVLGMMGLKTGLPLYIVGTSTFGATGGFIMPGFLMGLLQFGWLGVNIYFSSQALANALPIKAEILMVAWGVLAAFIGLKGIQYVAKVATYLPLIPIVTLIVLFFATVKGLGSFDAAKFVEFHKTMLGAAADKAPAAFTGFGLIVFLITYVVGFFATAGAAGVDFGTGARDERDVHMGGVVGIAAAIIFTAGLASLIVAGAYGQPEIANKVAAAAKEGKAVPVDAFNLIPFVLGSAAGKWIQFALAVAAFPSACFSSLIAANSFKTTLSKVNPFVSVGIGAAVSILLAVFGVAAKLGSVFALIGASFGPVCGAMAVDYILNGRKWAGPRQGFNPAGWLAWAFGFVVGIMPNLGLDLPLAPVWAMIVGAVIYFLAAKAGLQSPVMPMEGAKAEKEAELAAV
ncbi:MAG: cytosine permease [Bacillota bacterium]